MADTSDGAPASRATTDSAETDQPHAEAILAHGAVLLDTDPAAAPSSVLPAGQLSPTGTSFSANESDVFPASRPSEFASVRNPVQSFAEPVPEYPEWVYTLKDKLAKFETKFDNNAALYTAILFWIILNVDFFVWGVFLFVNNDIAGAARVTLPIAKGFGRAMSLNFALLLISGSKSFLTALRSTFLRHFVPFDHIMPYLHRIIGITAFSMFAGHTIFHIADYSLGVVSFTSGFWWTGGDSGTVSLATGVFMIAVATAMAVSVSRKARAKTVGFRLFFAFHLIGIVTFLILIPIHARNLTAVIILIVPMALYLADSLNRRFVRKSYATTVVSTDIVSESNGDTIVSLTFQKVSGLNHRAGQYMDICIPEVHKTEFHPFSIASGPAEDTLQMFIKVAGRWTGQLAEAVRDEIVMAQTKMQVRGPFGAPAEGYDRYNQILLVSSGIGVTPMRGIWRQLDADNKAVDHTPYNIIQTIKRPSSFIRFSRSSRVSGQRTGRFSVQRLQDIYSALGKHDVEELTHNLQREFVSPARVFTENQFAEAVHGSNFEAFVRAKPSKILRFTNSVLVNTLQLWIFAVLYGIWVCTLLAEGEVEVRDGLALLVTIPMAVQLCLSAVLSIKHFGLIYTTSLIGILTFVALLCNFAAFAITVVELTGTMGIAGYEIALLTICFVALIARFIALWWTFSTSVDLSDEKEDPKDKEKPIEADFVWVTRKVEGSHWLLNSLASDSSHWKPQVYFSQEQAEDLMEESRSDVELRAGRPNWDTILADLLDYYHPKWDGRAVIGVLFCGAPVIAQNIKEAIGRAERVHFQRKIEEAVAEGEDPDALTCKCRAIFHMENF